MPKDNGSGRCIRKARRHGNGVPRTEGNVSRDDAQRHINQLVRFGGFSLNEPTALAEDKGISRIVVGKDGFSWVFDGPREAIARLYVAIMQQLPDRLKPHEQGALASA